VYIAGKQVVIANWEALPKDVQEKLETVDKIATQYDKSRTVLKPAIEEAVKKLDANSTLTNNQKHQSK